MKNFWNQLKQFHNNEDGINALEIVIILAIACSVVAILIMWGGKIVDWGKTLLNKVLDNKGGITEGGGGAK
jgi:Flp pilus assembly pilin Flp